MARTFDPSTLLETFKVETREYLATLTHGLLSLEKHPSQQAVIEEIFRAAHTIKGSARMMGRMDIQDIAHQLEDLFGKLQAGDLMLNSAMADQALESVDTISRLLETAVQDNLATVKVPPADNKIEQYVVGVTAAPLMPSAAPPRPSASVGPMQHPAPTPAEAVPPGRPDEFVRVPVSRVNALMNLVGELVIHKVKCSYKNSHLRQLRQQATLCNKRLTRILEHARDDGPPPEDWRQLLHEYQAEAGAVHNRVIELVDLLSAEALHLDPVIDEMQYKIKELRMLPCATIFEGFERLVRDLAHQENKDIQLVVEGQDTELDKKILETIKPCLVHLLRNAVDHGIELPADRAAAGKPSTGTIWLRASQQGASAVIEVEDDGRGIDLARIKETALRKHMASCDELDAMSEGELTSLIFAPGFSTSPIITDVSGRGVGMDVVRKEVEQLKGNISVQSQPAQGTRAIIRLPLTVTIMQVLLVQAGGQRFGLPMLAIEEIVRCQPNEVRTVRNQMAIFLRDATVPIVRLADVLRLPAVEPAEAAPTGWPVVIASSAGRQIGLIVDQVIGEEETFIKGLPAHLGALKNVGGASILGTGEVAIILDVQDVLTSARQTCAQAPRSAPAPAKRTRRLLVAEDSLTTREFERSLLEAQGYFVETAVDGLDALEKLARDKFDLVISDVQMPRMDGFEFCRQVRQQPALQELPFVFVTTLDKEEEKRQGIEAGAQAYIVKGAFNQTNLLETIDRLIG